MRMISNILAPTSNLTSFTFSTQVPEEAEKEEVAAHEGDCFAVKVGDDPCFSISSEQKQCFFIDREGEDEEEEKPPELDFSEIGFTEIKCVQAHGVNELIIIGTYKPTDDPAINIIANIIYIPNPYFGGIKTLVSVYSYNLLSDYEIYSLDDVSRLDGYDVQSSIKGVCIVLTDANVIWLNGATLDEITKTSDFTTYNGEAASSPYWDEDTYSFEGRHLGGTITKEWPNSLNGYEVYNNENPDCTMDPDCANADIYCSIGDVLLEEPYYYVGTRDQVTGDTKITEEPSDRQARGTPVDVCYSEGDSYYGNGYINVKREGLLITSEDELFIMDMPSLSSSSTRQIHIALRDGDYTKFTVTPYLSTGAYLGDTNLSLPNSGIKVGVDWQYIVNYKVEDDLLYYTKIDGEKNGTLNDAYNSTIVMGVVIVADETSIVQQIILDDEE